MKLGLPYKGSKNTIAEDLVKRLPRGKKLLDACCGGGAVLMAAAVGSSKTTSREKLYYNGSADEYRALMGRYFDEKSEQMTLY